MMTLRSVALLACLLLPSVVQAQQRPLVTEDPETIGSGVVLIEGGVEALREVTYPLSGLKGNLLRLPVLGASFGLSSIAELQIDFPLYQRLSITQANTAPVSDELEISGDSTRDTGDITIGTKIRLFSETAGRPAFGVRFATRLPTTSIESGLGTDTMDFHLTAIVGKTVQSIRVVGNIGIGVLSDPIESGGQNDVLLYGLSLARAIKEGFEVVGEANGRLHVRHDDPPPGAESRGAMRFGVRFTRGTVRVDGGLIVGLTSRDPGIGFTAGATWVFRGFTIP